MGILLDSYLVLKYNANLLILWAHKWQVEL